jgi:hypothetical protein
VRKRVAVTDVTSNLSQDILDFVHVALEIRGAAGRSRKPFQKSRIGLALQRVDDAGKGQSHTLRVGL